MDEIGQCKEEEVTQKFKWIDHIYSGIWIRITYRSTKEQLLYSFGCSSSEGGLDFNRDKTTYIKQTNSPHAGFKY